MQARAACIVHIGRTAPYAVHRRSGPPSLRYEGRYDYARSNNAVFRILLPQIDLSYAHLGVGFAAEQTLLGAH